MRGVFDDSDPARKRFDFQRNQHQDGGGSADVYTRCHFRGHGQTAVLPALFEASFVKVPCPLLDDTAVRQGVDYGNVAVS